MNKFLMIWAAALFAGFIAVAGVVMETWRVSAWSLR
jgi:hypothetical protein